MQRNGLNGGTFTTGQGYTAGTFGMIDNLTYSINDKNQLTTIAEASLLNKGFKKVNQQFGVTNVPTNYTYDTNGNMISDQSKGIVSIEYNYLNLPQKILFVQNNCDITFVYDASGTKLRKIVNQYGTKTNYDYVGGVEYKNNSLERISNTEGAVTKNASGVYEYEYVLRDHLGNTRATFSDTNNDGVVTSTDIKQINHYYPFGLNMEGNWTPKGANGEGNKYQYNGKELNDDFGLNWNHHDWRFLDVAINRWVTVDPQAESDDQIGLSPYHFSYNNPIRFSDPDGLEGGIGDLVAGLAGNVVGLADNLMGTNFRENVGNAVYGTGGRRDEFDAGVTRADKASLVAGAVMVVGGTGIASGGAAVSLSGVGATVGVPAMVVGGATAVVGGLLTTNAAKNLGNSKVEAKENRRVTKEHTKNASERTKNTHEEGQARKAKEQKTADEKYAKTKSTKKEKSNNEKKKENPDYKRLGPKLE